MNSLMTRSPAKKTAKANKARSGKRKMTSARPRKPVKARSVPLIRPAVPDVLPDSTEGLIALAEKLWPAPHTPGIGRLFAAIRSSIGPRPAVAQAPSTPLDTPREGAEQPIDLLDLLRRTFSAHDLLFLRRQVTYHIAASSSLPRVYVDEGRVGTATSSLLAYMATRAPRGSRLSVQLGEISLRSGKGIEAIFAGLDPSLKNIDKMAFLHRMYEAGSADDLVLVTCRELVSSQGGQMWADLQGPKHAAYHMILPSSPDAAIHARQPHKMFKYDISIANYPTVRKRFGIKKSLGLVGQIELYVRALVRHPIDIVTAVRERGVISAIYESPSGSAQSVAGRISQRLGAEEFRIGKKPVELSFRYNLTQLATGGSQHATAGKEAQHP